MAPGLERHVRPFPAAVREEHENLIRDVRKDLKVPNLPVVIGLMGQNGFKEAQGNMAIVKAAQASMNDVADFKGNVKAIPTDIYWDKAANEAFPNWRKNFEQWQARIRFPLSLPRQHHHLYPHRPGVWQNDD